MRPEAQERCQVSDWFNILVLHQNRLVKILPDDNNWKSPLLTCLRSALSFSRTIENLVWVIMLLSFLATFSRVKTNPKNAINEHFLPRFLDFIVWGHEHECLVDPQVLLILELLGFCPRLLNYFPSCEVGSVEAYLFTGGPRYGFSHYSARFFCCNITDWGWIKTKTCTPLRD